MRPGLTSTNTSIQSHVNINAEKHQTKHLKNAQEKKEKSLKIAKNISFNAKYKCQKYSFFVII